MLLDHEQVGVVAAVWQWGHFTNGTIDGLEILRKSPRGIFVEVVTRVAFEPSTKLTLLVQYPMLGRIDDTEGNVWYFIVGDHGLEFRAA